MPERLRGALRGDLDWITMKALEKDRTRRYGSAADLASDVRRHLRNEPVLASPPSAAYRTRKFLRRNRLGVGISAVLTLLLAGFAATMVFQAGRIARERDRANAEAKAAREVTEFLVSSFELVDPMDARGDSITAREVLELGAQRIERELGNQPLLRAQMMDAIGRVYRDLGRLERAEDLLEAALALRQAELGGRHVDTAESMTTLAGLRLFQQRKDEGKELARQALAIQEELLGDHVDTAWTLYNLAWLEFSAPTPYHVRVRDQIELLERALAIFENPESSDARGASWCWNDLGVAYFAMGNFAKALECSERAVEIKERIPPTGHADIAISWGTLGRALLYLGDLAAAEPYSKRALDAFEKTLGPNHWLTASELHNRGTAVREAGDFAAAKELLERAQAICRETWGEESYPLGLVLDELGQVAHATGQFAEAENLYAQAVPMVEKNFGPDEGDVYLVGLLEHYAATLRELNRDAKAESLETRAKAIREKLKQSSEAN